MHLMQCRAIHISKIAALQAVAGVLLANNVVVREPPAAPLSQSSGSGLRGFVYLGKNVSSLAEADRVIQASKPDGEFRAYRIDFSNFPPSGGQNLASFLGTALSVPHAGYLPPSLSRKDIMPSIIRLTGFVRIAKRSARFAINSDDGSRLTIGGETVIDNDGGHGPSFGPGVADVHFMSPGLYPIEIVYFETGGLGASLALFVDAVGSTPCEGCMTAPPDPTMTVASTAVLYSDRSLLDRLLRPSAEKPRLGLRADRDSAPVGETISYNVSLKNDVGEPVASATDLSVSLLSDGGEFQPSNRVVIPKGSSAATAKLLVGKVGDFLVHALVEGKPTIDPAELNNVGCATSTEIRSILMEPIKSTRGYTDSYLSFRVLFVDQNNKPTTVANETKFGLIPKGVGELTAYDVNAKKLDQRLSGTVKKGECISTAVASSGEAGLLSVQADYDPLKITKTLDLTFMLRLSFTLLLVAVVGSLPGTFVRLQRRRLRKKATIRRAYVVGCIAGAAAYLFYYFFVSLKGVRLSDGHGVALLVGLLGGYLGSAVLERASGWLIPRAGKEESGDPGAA